jgi:lipopolysaccharide export LptBFGC system permease protein LptF
LLTLSVRIIHRYILKRFFSYWSALLFGIIAVLLLFWFTALQLRHPQLMSVVGMDLLVAILRNVMPFALPISLLVSAICVASQLSSSNEIAVLECAGRSRLSVFWPIVFLGVLGSAYLYYLTGYVLPRAEWNIYFLRKEALRRPEVLLKLAKERAIDPAGFSVDFDSLRRDETETDSAVSVTGLTSARRGKDVLDVLVADSAIVTGSPDGNRVFLRMRDGEAARVQVSAAEPCRSLRFEEFASSVRSPASIGYPRDRTIKPSYRTNRELSVTDPEIAAALADNRRSSGAKAVKAAFRSELWRRRNMALSAVLCVVLGLGLGICQHRLGLIGALALGLGFVLGVYLPVTLAAAPLAGAGVNAAGLAAASWVFLRGRLVR